MKFVGCFDDIVSASLNVYGGVAFIACLADFVAAVRDDGYFAGLDFGGSSGGVRTVPVPRN